MEQYPVTFEVRTLFTEEVWDQDEDNNSYKYWDIWDSEKIGDITIYIQDENDDFSEDDLILQLYTKLFVTGKIYLETKDQGLSYQVFNSNTHEPLLELILT